MEMVEAEWVDEDEGLSCLVITCSFVCGRSFLSVDQNIRIAKRRGGVGFLLSYFLGPAGRKEGGEGGGESTGRCTRDFATSHRHTHIPRDTKPREHRASSPKLEAKTYTRH
jgi:hypothetical protein